MQFGSQSLMSRVLASAAIAATFSFSTTALAQSSYPSRPITLISPYSTGGDADHAARGWAAVGQRVLGQTVIVLNKVGASGVIGSAQVVAAEPDGYTLLLARTGSQAILPAIEPTATKYKWDDYTFIGTLELNPYGCVVNAKSPYKKFEDLADAIRTKGKSLNYATAGSLTTNDMGPRQLFRLLKVTDQVPTQIPYKGTGDASMSVMGNETEFACGSLGPFLGLIKNGDLRALMVTTAERIDPLPDVPTARELGYKDMELIVGWSAIYGPPGMSDEVRDKIWDAMQKVAKDPAWLKSTAVTGSIPYVKGPEETREFARQQHQLYRTLGESLNIIDSKK